MRLWEKNFLLTITLLLLVLYGSTFFIQNRSFQTNFDQVCDNALWAEQNILSSVQNLFNTDETHTKLRLYCQTLKNKKISFALYIDGTAFTDSLPVPVSGSRTDSLIIKNGKHKYLYISESFTAQNQIIALHYAENLDAFYASHQKQLCLFLTVNAAISFLLAGILYSAMKGMYRPISNIAHELRTPLTAIQGYAQYILFGNISREDIHYASDQINREAGYINEIIERLLVMEHIQNGEIHLEKLDISELFKTIKTHYPSIVIENEMSSLFGDRTLLLCLFMNLLSNTSRSGDQITITASQGKITLCNHEDFIEEDILKILNENKPVPKDRIHGKGLGVPLCHEIVKLHRGQIHYESSKQEGVRIILTLPV